MDIRLEMSRDVDHVGCHGNKRYVIKEHVTVTWYYITSYVTTKEVVITRSGE